MMKYDDRANDLICSCFQRARKWTRLAFFSERLRWRKEFPPVLVVKIKRKIMSARQAPVKAVRVYRDLLRTLRQHVTSNAQTTDWLQYVSAEFRRHQHVTDAAEVKRLLTTAQNYKEMLNAVADHQVHSKSIHLLPSRQCRLSIHFSVRCSHSFVHVIFERC
jgi:hypothetical protein